MRWFCWDHGGLVKVADGAPVALTGSGKLGIKVDACMAAKYPQLVMDCIGAPGISESVVRLGNTFDAILFVVRTHGKEEDLLLN